MKGVKRYYKIHLLQSNKYLQQTCEFYKKHTNQVVKKLCEKKSIPNSALVVYGQQGNQVFARTKNVPSVGRENCQRRSGNKRSVPDTTQETDFQPKENGDSFKVTTF